MKVARTDIVCNNSDQQVLALTLSDGLEKRFSSCYDWLLQYFDVRAEARKSEIESLTTAKAVLSGADFSFVQKDRQDKFLHRH